MTTVEERAPALVAIKVDEVGVSLRARAAGD